MRIHIPIHPAAVPWFLVAMILATVLAPRLVAAWCVVLVAQAWRDAKEE